MGIYRLTAHSFVILRFVVGLIIFTAGTQLNIYITFVNPCNFKTLDRFKRSWLVIQQLISGMDCQLTCYYRERFMASALYIKRYDICCMVMRLLQ